MVKGDWPLDDYLAFAVQTHDDTGAAAAADAVPSYVIRDAETGASVATGNMAAVAGVDGFYTALLQLTTVAGFAVDTSYTLRVTATMSGAVAACVEVFRVGVPAVNVTYSAGVALSGRLAEYADLPAAAPTAAAIADAVWDEAISGHLTSSTTGAALNTAASAGGSGSTAYSNTITDDSSNPLDGVEVWITSDSGGASTVASTTTDTLGAFTVYLDPGTYYLWLAKGGYNFPNPTTITVS